MQIDEAAVRKLYARGAWAPEIAQALGVTVWPVLRVIRKLALTREPSPRALAAALDAAELNRQADAAHAAYLDILDRRAKAWRKAMDLGMSSYALGEIADVDHSTVQKAVNKLRERRAA